MKLTSKGLEFTFPVEVSDVLRFYTLEEISQQLYDTMTYDRKAEWDEENYAIEKIEDGRVIEVTVDFPDNFDGTNIMQINVRTGCVDELKDLKTLIIAIDDEIASLKKGDINDF